VSDEAQRLLDLGAIRQRNEFNSSFYTVVEIARLSPDDAYKLLKSRLHTESGAALIPRSAARAIGVVTGGVPREVVRLGDLTADDRSARESDPAQNALLIAGRTEALELRNEAISAPSLGGRRPLSDDTKVAVFRALPDHVFDEGLQTFREFGLRCVRERWDPSWPADEVPSEFIEEWRRVLVRLRLAAIMADDAFPLEDDDVAQAAQTIAHLTSQSAAVALAAIDTWIQDDARVQPCSTQPGAASEARLMVENQ
jgi:hypothetical protein